MIMAVHIVWYFFVLLKNAFQYNFTLHNNINFLYRTQQGPGWFSKQTILNQKYNVDTGTARRPAKICRTYKKM